MEDPTSEPARTTPHDALLFVGGEVDIGRVGELQRRLGQANAHGHELTVDLSAVTFIDCAGLSPLLEARKTQRTSGGRLRLAGPSSAVLRLLQLSGVLTAFTIVDNETPPLVRVRRDSAGAPALGRPSSTSSPPTAPPDDEGPSAETTGPSRATDEVEQLRAQLRSLRAMMGTRPTIDQAKGLLMAERRCDAEQAWAALVQASQTRNVKVRDLAAALTRAVDEPDTANGTAGDAAAPVGEPDPATSPAMAAALGDLRSQAPDSRDGAEAVGHSRRSVEPAPGVPQPAHPTHSSSPEEDRGGAERSVFAQAADAVVAHLQVLAPLELWMVTRVQDVDQIVVASAGPASAHIPSGTALPWLNSLSLHMAAGRAPQVAPRVEDVALYAAAATAGLAHVRGYTGLPLVRGDGELIGALCGLSTETDDPSVTDSTATVRLLQKLLTAIETTEQASDEYGPPRRAGELADPVAVTELSNDRG